jgi:hypothetical protein
VLDEVDANMVLHLLTSLSLFISGLEIRYQVLERSTSYDHMTHIWSWLKLLLLEQRPGVDEVCMKSSSIFTKNL